MDSGTVVAVVTDVQTIGDEILETLEGLAPGVAVPAELAQTVLDLIARFATKAIGAYSAASGTPITVETLTALLPNSTPLTAPTE